MAEQDGQIIGGAQMLVKRLPVVGGFGYVPRGPVVAAGADEVADMVIRRLQTEAKAQRVRHLVVQPARDGNWVEDRLTTLGFTPSELSVAPTATVVVDLTPSLDELFQNMSKSTRRHVKRAQREAVTIRQGSRHDLDVFHSLLTASSERHGFNSYSLEYFRTMWDAFHPAGNIELFLAELGDEIVSAHLAIPFGNVFLSKFSAWSGRHSKAYPNEMLDWHLIRRAKEMDYQFYDLEGFDRATADQLAQGAANSTPGRTTDSYKLKFGGEVVVLPSAFDYFPSALVARSYGRIYGKLTTGGWPRPSIDRLRIRRNRNKEEHK